MQEAYNEYDEEDEEVESMKHVRDGSHSKSLSGKFNAITNLNQLRQGIDHNTIDPSDYGSPQLDPAERDPMRQVHN